MRTKKNTGQAQERIQLGMKGLIKRYVAKVIKIISRSNAKGIPLLIVAILAL